MMWGVGQGFRRHMAVSPDAWLFLYVVKPAANQQQGETPCKNSCIQLGSKVRALPASQRTASICKLISNNSLGFNPSYFLVSAVSDCFLWPAKRFLCISYVPLYVFMTVTEVGLDLGQRCESSSTFSSSVTTKLMKTVHDLPTSAPSSSAVSKDWDLYPLKAITMLSP